jgi:hypothetical protein
MENIISSFLSAMERKMLEDGDGNTELIKNSLV